MMVSHPYSAPAELWAKAADVEFPGLNTIWTEKHEFHATTARELAMAKHLFKYGRWRLHSRSAAWSMTSAASGGQTVAAATPVELLHKLIQKVNDNGGIYTAVIQEKGESSRKPVVYFIYKG